jgi:hypothetical protein
VAAPPRERQPGALIGHGGSGRRQAHRRLPQPRQTRAVSRSGQSVRRSTMPRHPRLARSAFRRPFGQPPAFRIRRNCLLSAAALLRSLPSESLPSVDRLHRDFSVRWLQRRPSATPLCAVGQSQLRSHGAICRQPETGWTLFEPPQERIRCRARAVMNPQVTAAPPSPISACRRSARVSISTSSSVATP